MDSDTDRHDASSGAEGSATGGYLQNRAHFPQAGELNPHSAAPGGGGNPQVTDWAEIVIAAQKALNGVRDALIHGHDPQCHALALNQSVLALNWWLEK